MLTSIYKLLLIVLLPVIVISACSSNSTTPSSNDVSIPSNQANLDNLGATKVSDRDGMTLSFVPAGEFLMGTKVGMTDESPLHKVYLDAYWVDRTEVTNAMYALCVKSGECNQPSSLVFYNDPSYADHPVEYVSWNNAVDYCSWAGRRLPTEAEWEKVATWNPYTSQQRVYPWGNTYDCKMGNFDDETELDASLMPSGDVNCDGYVYSAPVGSYPQGASVYGVLDLGGNVWEWVHDAFIEVDPLTSSIQNYYAVSPAKNPQGVDPAITDYRGMRGGSYNFTFGFGRSAYRLWYGLDDSYPGVGFRCAMDAST